LENITWETFADGGFLFSFKAGHVDLGLIHEEAFGAVFEVQERVNFWEVGINCTVGLVHLFFLLDKFGWFLKALIFVSEKETRFSLS
jgi:hypothetical protein